MSHKSKITYPCGFCVKGLITVDHFHCQHCFGKNYSENRMFCAYCNNTGKIPCQSPMKIFCARCGGTGKQSYFQ